MKSPASLAQNPPKKTQTRPWPRRQTEQGKYPGGFEQLKKTDSVLIELLSGFEFDFPTSVFGRSGSEARSIISLPSSVMQNSL
jgi:hypothetical protein